MLHALRPTYRMLPQAHNLVICVFTPPLTLPASLLKRITHPYPFCFLLPRQSALRLPVLDADTHSPCYCRAPHLPPLALAPSRAPPAPSRHARWFWWCSLCPLRVLPPAELSPVLVAVVLARVAGAGCLWCSRATGGSSPYVSVNSGH